jgi:hypothetical protein
VKARALTCLLPAAVLCQAADCGASAVASGRHWRVAVNSIECEAAASLITIGARIHYLGSTGPVEAPVSRLIDGKGKPYLPRSLVWKSGSKQLAALLVAGGLKTMQSEDHSEIQLKFEVRDAAGGLQLELGDIKAFALTRKRTSAAVCESLLKPDQVEVTRRSRPARVEDAKLRIRVYRSAYPCVPQSRAEAGLRTTEAEYPPYLPRQLLLFGRGYLPSTRQVELPMGSSAAQSYSYAGPDNLDAIENAARRAVAADFPEYRSGLVAPTADGSPAGKKFFAFNWGPQKAQSGNEAHSIGIYDLRSCAG